MCAALWTVRLQQGLPGGQPRRDEPLSGLDLGAATGDVPDRPLRPTAPPRRARSRRPQQPIAYAACESPFGAVHLAATADGVCAVSLYETAAEFGARVAPDGWGEPAAEGLLAMAVTELSEYFAGRRQQFTVPVVLPTATAFDRRVLAAIAAIPYGATCTYGELARALDSPGAARAVGHACGRNPVPLLIPCHRVVRGTGALAGYGAGGPTVKAALLALERQARAG